MSARHRARPKFQPTPEQSVRQWMARTDWLDAAPHWHEGRVCWPLGEGDGSRFRRFDSGDLAAAARILERLGGDVRALEIHGGLQAGQGENWLVTRRDRLQIAQLLVPILATDMSVLARASHARNPETARRLVWLLSAEAHCANGLPISPAIALLRIPGALVGELLLDFCADENNLLAARALAALLLGTRRSPLAPGAKPMCEIYFWGRENGRTATPAITARLLLAANGARLANRFLAALPRCDSLGITREFWQKRLVAGESPESLVVLAETISAWDGVAARVAQDDIHSLHFDLQNASHRFRVSVEECRNQRREFSAQLIELLGELSGTGDAATLCELRDLVTRILDMESGLALWMADAKSAPRDSVLVWSHLRGHVVETALLVLKSVAELSQEKRDFAVRLLLEEFDTIWQFDKLPKVARLRSAPRAAERWLRGSWFPTGWNIVRVADTYDEGTAREIVRLALTANLAGFAWKSPEVANYVLELWREFASDPIVKKYRVQNLCCLFTSTPSLASARATMRPLVDELRKLDCELQGCALIALAMHLNWDEEISQRAIRLAPFVPQIARIARHDDWNAANFASAALVLEELFKAQAAKRVGSEIQVEQDENYCSRPTIDARQLGDCVAWMCDDVLRTRPSGEDADDPIGYYNLRHATQLAWALGAGRLDEFKKLFAKIARINLSDYDSIRRACAALDRHPALRPALAHMMLRQPERCLRTLKRLGLAQRLGDVLWPLDEFRDEPTAVPLAWRDLLQLAPDCWESAVRLALAQKICGETLEVPRGVRAVLAWPQQWSRELEHLQKLHESNPQPKLAARISGLQNRLAAPEELRACMRAEVEEKLAEIAGEISLRAVRQQLTAVYRARLDDVAGPLPEGLHLDTNWLNATLLTADVEFNRKLLRRLLRCEVRGEIGWREGLPGNEKFLAELAARAVDVEAWLGEQPRRYRTGQGSFSLRLEPRPLAILQMGNYFDTCLSFGGINSFSTVANACELNKRVIFARDDKGRVVGRKLIGINDDGALVGFHTYTSLQDAEANRALRRAFARFCTTFAERCRLKLAENGTVPKLFAEDWYDDGVVDWIDEDDNKPQRKDASENSRRVAPVAGSRSAIAEL